MEQNNLMEYKWLLVGRRSLRWECDSKSAKHENGKVDGLMWAIDPSQPGTGHRLQELLQPWDAGAVEPMGGLGGECWGNPPKSQSVLMLPEHPRCAVPEHSNQLSVAWRVPSQT